MAKVFAISDTHFPYHSKAAYTAMLKAIKRERPTHVVQLGDLLDQYVFSKYPRSLKISPKMDIERGIFYAEKMWDDIKIAAPKAKKYQIMGNHCERVNKRIIEKLPELAEFFNADNWYKFDNVTTLKSARDHLEIEGVIYVHGWLSQSLAHTRHFLKPVVHGHTHAASIIYDSPNLWAMSCGYMADKKQMPMQYTMSKLVKWVLACGVIEDKRPRLVTF